MDLWLVRHGESTANAGERTESPGGTPLTSRGRRQAVAVAREFFNPPGLIVVSPFLRTQQTAEPLLQKYRLTAAEWPVQEWIYLDPSRYVGTTQTERVPAVQAFVDRNDAEFKDGPDAESFVELLDRVTDFAQRVEKAIAEQPVVVFSHGRFIQAVLWRLFCGDNVPKSEAIRSFWAFSDSFSVDNCLMLRLQRGTYGWFLGGRRDVRLQGDEEGPPSR